MSEKKKGHEIKKTPQELLDRYRHSSLFAVIFYGGMLILFYSVAGLGVVGLPWETAMGIQVLGEGFLLCLPLLLLFAFSSRLDRWRRQLNAKGLTFFSLVFVSSFLGLFFYLVRTL